jgi:hypothetical protein
MNDDTFVELFDVCYTNADWGEEKQGQPTMRITPSLLARGFIGRSIDEFKRLSVIGLQPSSLSEYRLTEVLQL